MDATRHKDEAWTDSPTEFQRPQVQSLGMVAGICPNCNHAVYWHEPHKFISRDGFLRIEHRGCDAETAE